MIFQKFFSKPGLTTEQTSIEKSLMSVQEILTTEYCDLMHDLMMGDDFEEIVKNNPMNNTRVNQLKIYLEECGIPIYAAPAIYNYTVNSDEMLSVKRKKKTIDDLQADVYTDLTRNLSTSYPEHYVEALVTCIKDYYNDYVFKGKTQDQVTYDSAMLADKLGINMGPVTNASYRLHKIDKIKENIPILDYALETHEVRKINDDKSDNKNFIDEDITVYRAIRISRSLKEKCGGDVKNLAGVSLRNNFPTSTSKTYDQSFGPRKGYDLVFVIKVPKGSRGIDIEALSNYGKAEGEILLARNNFVIEKVEYKEDNRGQMRYFAYGTLDQKELIQERALLDQASQEEGQLFDMEERE